MAWYWVRDFLPTQPPTARVRVLSTSPERVRAVILCTNPTVRVGARVANALNRLYGETTAPRFDEETGEVIAWPGMPTDVPRENEARN